VFHRRQHAAAAQRASMVGALPGRAHEPSSGTVGKRRIRWQVALQGFERGGNVVAQSFEPGARLGFAGLDLSSVHHDPLTRSAGVILPWRWARYTKANAGVTEGCGAV